MSAIFGAAALASAVSAPSTVTLSAAKGATFRVHMSLTGSIIGSTTFSVFGPDLKCTDKGEFAPGSNGWGVPAPGTEKVMFKGVELQYVIDLPSFHGAGKYGSSAFTDTTLTADKASQKDPFEANGGATEAMVINKDASGSFVFSHWHNVNERRSLNGKFTWTCKD